MTKSMNSYCEHKQLKHSFSDPHWTLWAFIVHVLHKTTVSSPCSTTLCDGFYKGSPQKLEFESNWPCSGLWFCQASAHWSKDARQLIFTLIIWNQSFCCMNNSQQCSCWSNCNTWNFCLGEAVRIIWLYIVIIFQHFFCLHDHIMRIIWHPIFRVDLEWSLG